MTELRIATRQSRLALAQASLVADMLQRAHPDVEVSFVGVETTGDRDRTSAVAVLTEVGAFVRAVQTVVLEGRADLAVHSLKDLPVAGPEELVLAALPERAVPFDVLVGKTLDELESGSVVGTGSPRRVAQLRQLRPDVSTTELRGNVDTRLRKTQRGDVAASVLAEAGLKRLGRTELISQRFGIDDMVPAPGQGALAIETLRDGNAAEMCAEIDDESLRSLIAAERGLLAETGAGCRSALGALATWERRRLRLDAFLDDEQGPRRVVVEGDAPEHVIALARKELRV